MKIDGLETEVAALKTLVLTSTPSQPNKHLHPQLQTDQKGGGGSGGRHVRAKSKEEGSSGMSSLPSSSMVGVGASPKTGSPRCVRTDEKINSVYKIDYFNLRTGLSNSGCSSLVLVNGTLSQDLADGSNACDGGEEEHSLKMIDPAIRKDYLAWKKDPTLDRGHPFLTRIYK